MAFKKKPSEARRRTKPLKPEKKIDYPILTALARNIAELESRIAKSNRQSLVHQRAADRFAAKIEVLMKVASELAGAGEIDGETFDSIVKKECEDLGVAEIGEGNDEEDGE